MDEKIFDRVEKKYLITPTQYKKLQKIVKEHMEKDSYYKSSIMNIYYDTDNFDLIIQSIEHPDFKEKLRARSYGGYDKVFLEIKTKILGRVNHNDNNIGYKRRVLISYKDYDEFESGKATALELAAHSIEEPTDLQIAKEIDYLVAHFNLKPRIFLHYDRESYKGEDDLRVTFDSNLKFRTRNLKFIKKSTDTPYFNSAKNIIMEIKAGCAIPLWLVHALSQEHIYPARFSKIGSIYEKIIKENLN